MAVLVANFGSDETLSEESIGRHSPKEPNAECPPDRQSASFPKTTIILIASDLLR